MCGIVGYIGKQEAYPILIKGLHRLEYRGYDSSGIALLNTAADLNIYKAKGRVADLETFCQGKDISGTIGIAHTRWATHGEPNHANAHPHYSQSEHIALIHNGIIENYVVLKESLKQKRYTFQSDTDTEVLVQLIEYIKTSDNVDISRAVQLALKQVIGAYAIAIIHRNCMRGRINIDNNHIVLSGIFDNKEKFLNARRILILACGTSWPLSTNRTLKLHKWPIIPSKFRKRKNV
jgi:glucosamine--fructose-6-phosphate aminotransferase (isomerizing)